MHELICEEKYDVFNKKFGSVLYLLIIGHFSKE